MPLHRGDIWWVDWEPGRGIEQKGHRPAVIIQSDLLNQEGVTSVIIAAMSTGGQGDEALHVTVEPSKLNGLTTKGVVKCEQILTVATERFVNYSGILEPRYLEKVDHALRMILSLR